MASSGNFATWNSLTLGSYSGLFNGNTTVRSINNADLAGVTATIGITTGKWYWETYVNFSGTGYVYAGLNSGYEGGGFYSGGSATNGMTPGAIRIRDTGALSDSSSSDDPDRWGTITLNSTGTASFTTGDIISFALDYDNKKLWISKNGTFFNSGDPAGGSNQQASWTGDVPIIYPCAEPYHTNNDFTLNAGQDSSFAGQKTSGSASAADGNGFGDFYYTPPTGFLALCTANVPISDDIDPAQTDDDFPQKQCGAFKYTGNSGSARTVSTGFQPDLIWIKRTDSSDNHYLQDSSRGFGNSKSISTNSTGEEGYNGGAPTSSGAQNVGASSFEAYGSDWSPGSGSMIAWCWRANAGTTASNTQGTITSTVQANTAAGFSIITFTSPSSSADQTVGHGLSAAPEFIIVKKRNSAANWNIFHKDLSANQGLRFSNAAPISNAFGTMSSTTIGVKSPYSYASGDTYVHYAWHSVEGYSKFGTYTANSSADGPFIYTGFRPAIIIIKGLVSGSGWVIKDDTLDGINPGTGVLEPNQSSAKYTSAGGVCDILSNGFKVTTTNAVANSTSYDPYVYAAWGSVPFKYNNTF